MDKSSHQKWETGHLAWGGALAAALAAGTVFRARHRSADEDAAPPQSQREPPDAADLPDGLPRSHIPAVFHPGFVPASHARIEPGAPIIGYARGGQARAYARRLLNGHEIVNDTVAGQHIVVTF
jgi:hypothetical protein